MNNTEEDILNLSDKIDLLYNFIYNINKKDNFSYDEILLGKINLDDIKISLATQTTTIYNKYLSEILDGKFKLLDVNDNQILLKKYSDQFPIFIKVSFYKNENELTSLDSKINNDSLMSYLLSSIVLKNKTKHILLPILNIDTKLDDITKLLLDKSITTKISNGELIDTCCLQIREQFFKLISLEEYIQTNKCAIKILLFQIIHTLAIIQNEYNGFRHNNLLLKNVYLYLKKESDILTEYIGFKNEPNPNFYIPNSGFDIKIGNFEDSIIPKYYGIDNTRNISIEDDLLMFINDLLKTINPEEKNKCIEELNKFIEVIKKGPIKLSDLLYDKYFKDFKNNPSKKDIKTLDRSNDDLNIINHEYLTKSKIKTVLDSDNQSILGKQYKISNYNIMTSNSRLLKESNSNEKKLIRNNDIKYIKSRVINTNTEDEIILERVNQYGGSKEEINPYKSERNNPSITNEQRRINTQRAAEVGPPKEQPLLLEQKIYDVNAQKPQKPQYPPSFIPVYDPEGQITNHLLPYSNRVINQPPIQKVYNISLSNPLGDHTTINRVYEDILPGAPYTFSSISVYERKQIIDFIRNSILEHNDGEEMSISGGTNSLLSFIKVLEVNPYVSNKNAFVALARNFLLYRGGYPIRFQDKTKTIGLAKPSIGVNIRLYKMTIGEYRCRKLENNINADNFHLWRELKYYDWVRNDIINKKISPNFVMPILYKLDTSSKIDWEKLENIKKKHTLSYISDKLRENDQLINQKHNLLKDESFISKNLPALQSFLPFMVARNKRINPTSTTTGKLDLTDDSRNVLVLLTESPNTSLMQWARTVYERNGTVKKMISSGYHTLEVWESVLFQLIYAFAVLQDKHMYLNNMSLENNFYIKDIFSDTNAIGSWIYNVDNVDFYVPNYGYVLQVDSYYTDINVDDRFMGSSTLSNQQYKVYGSIYKENSVMKDVDLRNKIFEQFKSIVHPDNFGDNFKKSGGVTPDASFLNLLKNISEQKENNIRKYLFIFFGKYLHNRVGTLLMKSEKENINILTKPIFIEGKLMAYQRRYQEFEWVIYVENSKSPLKKVILTKYGKEEVFSNSLYSYPETEIINPESKNNMKYDEYHIYETYNIDN